MVESDLKRDEGRRGRPYNDSRGIQTIGYGHNLQASELCEEALLAQLRHDIAEAVAGLDREISWWRGQPEPVQRVLINLAFNLGVPTLLTFQRTLGYLQGARYADAAKALLDSKYATQVGQRAVRLALLIRSVV